MIKPPLSIFSIKKKCYCILKFKIQNIHKQVKDNIHNLSGYNVDSRGKIHAGARFA